MKNPVCLITGVGPGTGSAISRKFSSQGYRVAMLARNAERLRDLEQELPGAQAFPCDVTDQTQINDALERIVHEMGVPEIFIHNAVGGLFGRFQEIDPNALLHNFKVNTMALLHFSQFLAPLMTKAGKGSIVVTGNTSAHRGVPNFAGFAPTKAAQRILAESIARDLGPQGIHVAYLVIDAVIDGAWQRERFKDKPDDFFIRPDDIAAEIYHLTQQPRSAWSFNAEIRPYSEAW